MRKVNDDYNNDGFFYMAGICFGRYYGDAPLEFRKKVVSKFKDWVTYKNGSGSLPTDQITVNSIVKQFLYEFKKGESRGRYKH